MPPNKRLFELDALRAVAITLIVFSHLILFIKSNIFILTVNSINFVFPVWFYGLSLFFFISGFVLHYKHPTISNRQDAINFLKRRVVRIYPLYWIALAVLITLGITLGMDAWNFFLVTIYFCGLQVFFPPGHEWFGLLWFVGLILLYYLIYLVLARLSNAPKLLFTAVFGVPLFLSYCG
jgi:peptidoglycan/LPS O-acetylase OafA/YrhL